MAHHLPEVWGALPSQRDAVISTAALGNLEEDTKCLHCDGISARCGREHDLVLGGETKGLRLKRGRGHAT